MHSFISHVRKQDKILHLLVKCWCFTYFSVFVHKNKVFASCNFLFQFDSSAQYSHSHSQQTLITSAQNMTLERHTFIRFVITFTILLLSQFSYVPFSLTFEQQLHLFLLHSTQKKKRTERTQHNKQPMERTIERERKRGFYMAKGER